MKAISSQAVPAKAPTFAEPSRNRVPQMSQSVHSTDGFKVGHDLGRVRVRAAAEDAPRARQLGALAYAIGNTVHMPPGLDRPRSRAGRELIAHETVHARQWSNGGAADTPQWSKSRLEDEARWLAPKLARGEDVAVHGVHRGDEPLAHPIFISTHGSAGYLRLAEQFYIRWGYGTPARVSSIEDMVENLAGGSGALSKVTLVSHAVPSNINISFLRGGPGFVLEDDWAIDTPEEMPDFAEHLTSESFLEDIVRQLRGDADASEQLDALGPQDVLGDPIAKQYLWWLLDVWFIRNQPARRRSARRSRDRVAALAEARVQTYRDVIAVAMATTAGLGSSGRAFSFEAFERSFTRVLADEGFRPGRIGMSGARRTVASGRNAAVDRIFHGMAAGGATFFDRLATVRSRLTSASHIEIQGCRVGRQPTYLDAMSTFFNGARVSAPDWFQIFGHVGTRSLAGDDDRSLRRLWRDRDVQTAFRHWFPILTGEPLPDRPGWEDFAEFMRDGHPLLVGQRLLLTRPMAEAALLEFLARHGYRITEIDELRSQFLDGRTIAGATSFALIDWLQENRNGRGGIAFRPDPAYQEHIQWSS